MTTLTEIDALIAQLPLLDRQRIQGCELKLWEVIDRYDDMGKLAVQVVALTIIEDEEEQAKLNQAHS